MTRLIGVALALMFLCGLCISVRAEDAPDATALVEKAVKALGGEEKLGKVKAASWKVKGKLTIMGNEVENTSQTTIQGLDHFRQELQGERDGQTFKIVTLLSEDKGLRAFGDMRNEMDKEAVSNTKRTAYLAAIPVTLLPLKSKDFKLETIAEEKVNDKPAVGIKVTAPDKKDFKLYFDKETGLPVKLVAKVAGFQPGTETTQETTFSDYKEMAGIKKATKIVVKRDGMKFMEQEVTEFKILDKVEPKTFTEI